MTTLILRPDGDDTAGCTPSSGTVNYAMVDESSADGDTTYVYGESARDLYDLEDHASESGTISNVRVHYRAKNYNSLIGNMYAMIVVGGTQYAQSPPQAITSSYADYYFDWAQNPKTTSAWTWTNIDDLIAGFNFSGMFGNLRCTQVYITVTYVGALTADDSQAANIRGQDTDEDSQSAYLEGKAAGTNVDSSQSAFLAGVESTSSTPAFVEGVERSSSPAFMEGAIGLFQKTLKLTIDSTQVAATQTDFPVLVKMWGTDIESDLATVANGGYVQNTALGGASGAVTVPCDLVFALDKFNNDVLDFEIEYYDPTTGQIHAWMRRDISSTADFDIFINFGDSGTIISQENIGRVWLDDYIAVYHLAEGSGIRYDSTVNNHHGTPAGSPGNIVNNGLYKGIDLGTDGDYIEIPWHSDFEVQDAFALEVWNKSDISTYTGMGFLVDLGGYDEDGFGIFASSNRLYGYYNGEFQASDIVLSTSSFYIYGLTYDGTTVRFIRDYTVRGSDVVSPGTIVHNPLRIGAASDSIGLYWDGWADEVRLSGKYRAEEYYETNHRMVWQYYQSSSWMTIGAVEDVTQTSSQSAWLEGYTAGVSNLPAYLSGIAAPTSSQAASMSGQIEIDSSQSAYLAGPSVLTSSISAFLQGPFSASSSVSAYMLCEPVYKSSIHAFTYSRWPAEYDVSNSISGYLEGDGVWPFTDDFTGTNGGDWAGLKWDTDKS